MEALSIDPQQSRYRAMIGTGGIGTGAFFALNGDHTLGREESRTGRFLPNRDYAKLHIISHYVQTLMGPEFQVLPVGRVGADAAGQRLSQEMAACGLDLRYVRALDGVSTMQCICLVYPDGSGGNLTVDDSACGRVDSAAVDEAEPAFAKWEGQGMALAVPEVPLEARARLLELASRHRFFRAASFTSEEAPVAVHEGLMAQVDLLVVNADEAAAVAEVSAGLGTVEVARAAVDVLRRANSGMKAIVTAGAQGSWAWDGGGLLHCPAVNVQAISAAGAGDAFFSGVLCGLAARLALAEAQQLGALVGALSTQSPHTIHPELDRCALADFVAKEQVLLTPGPGRMLAGSPG